MPEKERLRLKDLYTSTLARYIDFSADEFNRDFDAFVTLRLLQVLGVYGREGLGGRKQYFLDGIPVAIATLEGLNVQGRLPKELPLLASIVEQLSTYNSESGTCQLS